MEIKKIFRRKGDFIELTGFRGDSKLKRLFAAIDGHKKDFILWNVGHFVFKVNTTELNVGFDREVQNGATWVRVRHE